MGYRPRGVGLTGRGRNAPSPVFVCRWKHPPTARPLRGLLPPPPEGAGECLAIDPDTVSGEQERDSGVSVHTDGRERISPGRCIHGESPRGGGADGEGAERPFPCLRVSLETFLAGSPPLLSPVSLVERFTWITPTARPLRGLLPPPARGGGQSVAIVRIPCQGRGKLDFGRVFTLTAERGSLPGGVSMDNRPRGEGLTGRGRNAPSPVSTWH
jgi:hypothetical protein